MTTPSRLPPVADLISSCHFSPDDPLLVTTAWDGAVTVYDANPHTALTQTAPLCTIQHLSPVLDSAFSHNQTYIATLDGQVRRVDASTGVMGEGVGQRHLRAVAALRSIPERHMLVAGLWDRSVQYIDPRSPTSTSVSVPGKVFKMDANATHVVVCMNDRLVHLYDVRSPRVPLLTRESGLKYQTRNVRLMPNGEGYVQSLIEGRIAVEWIDASPRGDAMKYAFKCHRQNGTNEDGEEIDVVTSVNGLTFHPTHHTLFTGGSDGHVCVWDCATRKRLKQYSRYEHAVLLLDLSPHLEPLLAVCTGDESYKREARGSGEALGDPAPRRAAPSQVHLRLLGETEGRPKKKREVELGGRA